MTIKLALLDLNNNVPNQGFRNINEISTEFKENIDCEVEIESFDIRYKEEFPNIEDFDIFISSGGPGNPHFTGAKWETRFRNFLDDLLHHNRISEDKKYAFLICHSFQLATIHWDLGNVNKRHSFSFGVLPVHKTSLGKNEFLFENLRDPFFAVDSRAFQFIEPKRKKIKELGAKIVAIEKFRPYVPFERAVMAMRFSDEIFGTQFHPEANAEGFMKIIETDQKKRELIGEFGKAKYLKTIGLLHDPDKIPKTQSEILPKFLLAAAEEIKERNLTYA